MIDEWTNYNWVWFSYQVETINYPVWNVPFPSITICDVNKVHKLKIKRIKDILWVIFLCFKRWNLCAQFINYISMYLWTKHYCFRLSNKISEAEANEFFSSLSYLINSHHLTKPFVRIFEILDDEGITVETLMIEVNITVITFKKYNKHIQFITVWSEHIIFTVNAALPRNDDEVHMVGRWNRLLETV